MLLAFVRGIHRSPVNSPHKGLVTRKMFPFDDVIMKYFNCLRYVISVPRDRWEKMLTYFNASWTKFSMVTVNIMLKLLAVPGGHLFLQVVFLIALVVSSRLRQHLIIDLQIEPVLPNGLLSRLCLEWVTIILSSTSMYTLEQKFHKWWFLITVIASQITGNSTLCLEACSCSKKRKHQSSVNPPLAGEYTK